MEGAASLSAQGFNEGKGKPFTAADLRFTVKGDALYAVVYGWPESRQVKIKSLSEGNALRPAAVNKVEMLGGGELRFQRNNEGLEITLPENKPDLSYAVVLKIS
jgi:alpha-L-fucosidase